MFYDVIKTKHVSAKLLLKNKNHFYKGTFYQYTLRCCVSSSYIGLDNVVSLSIKMTKLRKTELDRKTLRTLHCLPMHSHIHATRIGVQNSNLNQSFAGRPTLIFWA